VNLNGRKSTNVHEIEMASKSADFVLIWQRFTLVICLADYRLSGATSQPKSHSDR
jgi:hypothetical protein